MNNKGFTLIETIIVIAIMAMLAILLIPNITGLIKQNKIDSCNDLKASIIRATELYVSDNRYNFDKYVEGEIVMDDDIEISLDGFSLDGDSSQSEDNTSYVTIETLINGGYLTGSIVNPLTNETIEKTKTVKITYNSTTKQYSYELDFINCSE